MPAEPAYFFSESHARLADDLEGFVERHLAGRPWPDDDESARERGRELVKFMGEAGLCRER